MKPAPFEYLAPDTLEAALEILAERGGEAKLLAGGQSLVPAMNFRMIRPGTLVDLNRLDGLDYIEPTGDGGLRIGAMTRQRRLETDRLVAERAPLLAEAMPHVAHPQIRNRGTLGGSLAHADPAAELPVIAVALDATIHVRSSRGSREVAADQCFTGMFTTDLSPEEILVEVEIPPMPRRMGWAFLEVARRRGDYAMLGVAAVVLLDERGVCRDSRLVYLNAGDGPVKAGQAASSLIGSHGDPAACEQAAAIASEDEIEPLGNLHASPRYQRHLAKVLTVRALGAAFARAAMNGM